MEPIKNIISVLEKYAPVQYQESYDNSGLITGNTNMEINGITVSLDCTEDVIDEAIAHKCNMVVAHHPILFSGLKKINGKNYVERAIIKAIKNDIALYAIHTNLDNVVNGVNAMLSDKLGLTNIRILAPKSNLLRKLVTYVPSNNVTEVRQSLFDAGAGSIGNYDECSFNVTGTGTFRANKGTNPFVGEHGKQHHEPEMRIELIYEIHKEQRIIAALNNVHPYEEVAYDIYDLENKLTTVGSGLIGETAEAFSEIEFLTHVKNVLNAGLIRHTKLLGRKIKKVAVCGGSGSFLLDNAIAAGADMFITADYKYHQFFDADGQIVIADVGHYESEQYTSNLLADLLKRNFSTFAVRLTSLNTNPVNYF